MNTAALMMIAFGLFHPGNHVFDPFRFLMHQIFCPHKMIYAIEEIPSEPQDETLLKSPLSFGGYGAFTVKTSWLNKEYALLLGGKGGLVINHAFVFGGGGYGLTNDILVDVLLPPATMFMDFGYGGVYFEYIMASRKLMHISANVLVGAGGVVLSDEYYFPEYDDAFFVLEPGADLELNFSHHFRVDFGASYRYIAGANLLGITSQDLSGPAINLTFKFGHF